MCSSVEHYFLINLIFFLYEFENVPQEKWFSALCPVKKKLCVPDRVGLSSSCLSPVKTIIGVPGKVDYLHYTTVLFNVPTSLSCSFPFVSVET